MRAQGIRRLFIISDDTRWCLETAEAFCQWLQGDWIWVGDARLSTDTLIGVKSVKKLLGQERLHGVFDATKGLDIDALAVLAGVLKAGSWLLMLVPHWDSWHRMPDRDSLRWSEQKHPIPTPHFISHFQRILLSHQEVAYWRQGSSPKLPIDIKRPKWRAPIGQPTSEQQTILNTLLSAKTGTWLLTAARGRGKSSLAGMFLSQCSGVCWVTAPRQSAIQILKNHSGKEINFVAPDALLNDCLKHQVDHVNWLVIDEAASFPIALLSKLLGYFRRILLTTTIDGYEGTGHAFVLKLFSQFPKAQWLTLNQPIRWAKSDPLEQILNEIMMLNKIPTELKEHLPKKIIAFTQSDELSQPHFLQAFYRLLSDAHYRTSTRDLRRLMDAPGMHFSATLSGDCILAVLWLVDEGGLDERLSRKIWAGHRRPPGSLVAQSLSAHSGQWWAPTLRSRRISRIAVMEKYRRQGIARQMILFEITRAKQAGLDFISVSFGYERELNDFWMVCGFKVVRIGSHNDTCSGCCTLMAIFPLSRAGEHLYEAAQKQMIRDAPWLKANFPFVLEKKEESQELNEEDWRELAGFAFAHRPLSASLASLQRLLKQRCIKSACSLIHLRKYLQKHTSQSHPIGSLDFTGRKALIVCLRNEVKQAVSCLDKKKSIAWAAWVENK